MKRTEAEFGYSNCKSNRKVNLIVSKSTVKFSLMTKNLNEDTNNL